MKVVSTEGLTKLIQLVKSAFIKVEDVVETSEVTLATVATSGKSSDLNNDAGFITSSYHDSSKADVDLSNINPTQTAKNTIVGWGVPDYNSAIALNISVKSSDYTIQNTGYYILGLAKDTANHGTGIFVNGLLVMSISITSAWETAYAVLFLKQGDIVSSDRTYVYYADIKYFVPCTGVS